MDSELREKMKTFFSDYKPSLESMMLRNDAQYLTEHDQKELMSYLPPFSGKIVLELGAGIGRLTSCFAQFADHVTTVDFIEAYVKQNKKANGSLKNVTFLCDDVTKLEFPEESYDLVFSNWLLMYLSNQEAEDLMQNILRWLKPEGFFFFREACYHQAANIIRNENPAIHRTPLEYIEMLSNVSKGDVGFGLISAKNILAYIHYHGNPNQLCLLAVKKNYLEDKDKEIERILEINQTSSLNETIHSLVDTPAGEFFLKNQCAKIGLRMGQRVLNIGCGRGSIPGYLVENHGVHVHGVELSPLNVHYAIEAQGKLPLKHRKLIQYEATDWMGADFTSEAYEFVLSFELLHSKAETLSLIKNAQTWLKQNGRLSCFVFISSENDESDDTLGEMELENYLTTLSLTLHEMKPQSDLALQCLRRNVFEMASTQSHVSHSKLKILQKRVRLLESKRITLVCIIASK